MGRWGGGDCTGHCLGIYIILFHTLHYPYRIHIFRDRTGLDWTGLDWTGLDWTGLDWTGLDWTGLDGMNTPSLMGYGQNGWGLYIYIYISIYAYMCSE